MIHLRENFYAVEVPEGLLQPEYTTEQSIGQIMGGEEGDDELVIRFTGKMCGSLRSNITVPIPPSTWQIVCTSKEAARDKAHEVVEHRWCEEVAGEEAMIYVFYENGKQVYSYDPLNALTALLTSKGCDLSKTYLILKKQ
jgi:hypothetical protein